MLSRGTLWTWQRPSQSARAWSSSIKGGEGAHGLRIGVRGHSEVEFGGTDIDAGAVRPQEGLALGGLGSFGAARTRFPPGVLWHRRVGLVMDECLAQSGRPESSKMKSKLLNGISRGWVSAPGPYQWLAHRTRHHANPRVHRQRQTAGGHHWRFGVELASAWARQLFLCTACAAQPKFLLPLPRAQRGWSANHALQACG